MANSFNKSLSILKTFSRYSQARRIVNSTSSMNVVSSKASPKIEEIANNIAQLNLIEVAELTDLLKKKLNLPDSPMMSFAAAPVANANANANASSAEEVSEAQTQNSFKVKLKNFDEKQKVALIKEIKSLISGMNLVQAKKFVESAPVVVKENLGKTEAEDLKAALEKTGAVVEIE